MFIIENVFFNEDDEALTLVGACGNILKFRLEGDCCSHSYFDADTKIDAKGLLGDTLLSMQYNWLSTDPDGYNETKNYALILKTNRQSISLLWRNSSNGYYSGTVVAFLNDEEKRYDTSAIKALGVDCQGW